MRAAYRPPTAPVWGDEGSVAREVLDWASNRVVVPTDPKSTARPASELARDAGPTVTAQGIGGHAALSVFVDVLAPAVRAQDDPMNLAYIPSAPTRAAVAFDAATSAANIFGGLWETGAGAIFAENEALDWLISLLGWPARPPPERSSPAAPWATSPRFTRPAGRHAPAAAIGRRAGGSSPAPRPRTPRSTVRRGCSTST